MHKKKSKLLLLSVLLGLLMSIFAILAFFIPDSSIQRFSLWSALVFGVATIILATVALFVSVDSNNKAECLRKQKVSDDANEFIINNNDEIAYIPLCLIANSLDNHHKFVRKIYNEFNKLNKELQNEVLLQLNYEYKLIKNNAWINKSIDSVRSFIKENDLGYDLLYNSDKYFHVALRYAEQEYNPGCEYTHYMPDYFHWNPKIFFKEDKAWQENVTFYDYLDAYLTMKDKNDPLYIVHKNKKPLDVLLTIINFSECSNDTICYWEMEAIKSICIIMERGFNKEKLKRLTKGDAEIETFEDRYLDVLMELYNLSLIK